METMTMDSELYIAARRGELSQQLIVKSGNPNNQISHPKEETILHLVARSDNIKCAELVREHCPNIIEKQNRKGDTALHIATRTGHINILRFLIEWAGQQFCTNLEAGDQEDGGKALLRKQNNDGNTILHEALLRSRGDLNLVETVLKADHQLVSIDNKKQESPLYLATERLLPGIVSKILEFDGINVSHKGPNGQTSLHIATVLGHQDLLSELVLKRPEWIKERDDDGKTPLYYAAYLGKYDAADKLLSRDKSCAYIKDNNGYYPIHVAASEGHCDIVKLLVNECPDAGDLLNEEDQSALHVAAKRGKEYVVKFFLRKKEFEMLINERDEDGNTPMHLATMNWHPKAMGPFTRDKRVDTSITNKKGRTALDIAEKNMGPYNSFRELITLAILRSARAPRSHHPPVITVHDKKDGTSDNEKENDQEDKEPKKKYYKNRVNTLVLVATLILTATFATGFTIPQVCPNEAPTNGTVVAPSNGTVVTPMNGKVVILSKTACSIFVICDSIALYTSIIVSITLMWAQTSNYKSLPLTLKLCSPILGIALTTMAIAFATAVYSAICNVEWLAFTVFAMGCVFIVLISLLFFQLHVFVWSKTHWLLFKYPLLVRVAVHAFVWNDK